MRSYVQDKNFYVLSALEQGPARVAVTAHPELAKIAESKKTALTRAATSCTPDLECYVSGLLWSDDEIQRVSAALSGLHQTNAGIGAAVEELKSSGLYQMHSGKAPGELIAIAWGLAARGMNNAIEIYGLGRAPRYPTIDSISHDVKSETYRRLVHVITTVLEDDKNPPDLFFHPSLRLALELMRANRRDEAGRHEPLHLIENAAAYKRVRSVKWADYPYSAIVIPSSGTQSYMISRSPYAEQRAILGARRWIEAKAPFVIVSGGYVHPSQTPHAEALETKKYLMSEFKIPAEAILIEPHARHTTTNIRNASRLIYRYGMPFDKPALVVTDGYHSTYIGEKTFADRCTEELGYVPYVGLKRTSQFELELLPSLNSLTANPLDPLDP